ncbi:anti-sigma factor family protein [Planctomycetota bacterium]
MLKCTDVNSELEAFLRDDVDEPQRTLMREHLEDCENCSQALRQLTRLSEVLQTWQGAEPSPLLYERVKSRMKNCHESSQREISNHLVRKVVFRLIEIAAIIALTLFISRGLDNPTPDVRDEPIAINFYLTEHQNVIARTASLNISSPKPSPVYVDRHDILYYEYLDAPYEFVRPSIIVRRPSSQQQRVVRPETPAISNGHTLSLTQAYEAVDFDVVLPPYLHPGYMLDQIRRIDDRDTLHLLFTDGMNTLSLFEQPAEGRRGLAVQDFREYAVFCNQGQAGGSILAWKDDTLSYVLIGNAKIAQLMDIAESIITAK